MSKKNQALAASTRPGQGSAGTGTPPTRSNWDRFWVLMGKLALVATVVWTSMQIYRFWLPEYDLQASGDHAPFKFPQAAVAELGGPSLRYDLSAYARQMFEPLPSTQPASTPAGAIPDTQPVLSQTEVWRMSDAIGDWFEQHYPSTVESLVKQSEDVVWITVRNAGRKEVTGLELNLAGKEGWFVLTQAGQASQWGVRYAHSLGEPKARYRTIGHGMAEVRVVEMGRSRSTCLPHEWRDCGSVSWRDGISYILEPALDRELGPAASRRILGCDVCRRERPPSRRRIFPIS